ncbi:hypothetical protein [Streptomyces buecherae]|uniref:hypothetical protein n=1 Tax=Streptomyces buecherae TaxID=2763006 RepID=UPI0036C428E2
MPTWTEYTSPPPFDWVPPGGGVRWTRIGELGWHTLSLPYYLGNRVLAALGDESGAVIEEDVPERLVWLIEPKAAAVRHLYGHEVVSLAGDDGSYVFVPGMARARMVWWRVPPEPERLLTDAGRLVEAIAVLRPGVRP